MEFGPGGTVHRLLNPLAPPVGLRLSSGATGVRAGGLRDGTYGPGDIPAAASHAVTVVP